MALLGHGGCGKTSIAEAMARITGRNSRLGRVDDQTSIMDYEPEEQKRGGSISSSFLTSMYDGYKVHVIDTPGDGNFLHEARGSLQGANAAAIVVSAVDGVEVSTEHVVGYARAQDVPIAVFINKVDRENADPSGVVKELADALDLQPVVLQIPIGTEDSFRGVVDLVSGKALMYSGDDGVGVEADIPADMADEVEAAMEAMMEAVAMADDELVEAYLEEGELTNAQIREGLNKGILAGEIAPVLFGCAAKNIGVDRLLWLARAFPSGSERSHMGTADEDDIEFEGDAAAPFAALCFKTIIDRFAGQISVFKVVSGTADSSANVINPRNARAERFGTLFHLLGKDQESVPEVVPGDVFGVAKLKGVKTGDTLSSADRPASVEWTPPRPAMISYTIRPKSRSDVDKLKSALAGILAEDPALREDYDSVTKEIVLSGMGASHVQLAVDKMARKFGVQLELGTPAVPYRETIRGRADVRYRHKKQTGGAGQFGEVAIRVYPSERGTGYKFKDVIKGGAIPNSLIPSVDKGITEQLKKGVLAGFPVLDVTVELYDGKYHPVDSKDIAFQIAGRQAIKQAVLDARPILLEPVYSVDIVVPSDQVGDVMGDMNSRRGRVLNMDTRGRNAVVQAHVPLAEMMNYAPDLRSMTGGKGYYTMEFHGYEQVPTHLQDKVVADLVKARAE
jgi:elongation factor G